MRHRALSILLASLVACGGGSSSPIGPTPQPPQTWTLAGQVNATLTGTPLAGVRLTTNTGLTSSTDAAGRLELTGTGNSAVALSLASDGIVTREGEPATLGATLLRSRPRVNENPGRFLSGREGITGSNGTLRSAPNRQHHQAPRDVIHPGNEAELWYREPIAAGQDHGHFQNRGNP